MSKKLLGLIGVDAGMIMVGDPCYFIGKDATVHKTFPDWKTACDELFCNEKYANDESYDIRGGLGIAVPTTHGDGTYPVYLEEKIGEDGESKRRLIVDLD